MICVYICIDRYVTNIIKHAINSSSTSNNNNNINNNNNDNNDDNASNASTSNKLLVDYRWL